MPAARSLLQMLALLACAASAPGAEAWRARDHLRPAQGILYQAPPHTGATEVYGQQLDLGAMSLAADHPEVAVLGVNAHLARP